VIEQVPSHIAPLGFFRSQGTALSQHGIMALIDESSIQIVTWDEAKILLAADASL
jgi:hypothetical protein